jgi:acetyltransferase
MITQGQELIIGSRRDPQFGPLLIVGTGGIEVELKQDIATGLAPMSPDRASRLLDRTKAGLRILGWRGSPAGDRQAVIDAMIRLGQLADDFPELQEIEVNPLIVLAEGSGVVAIDVRGSYNKPKA